LVFLFSAALGAVFAAVSSHDFVMHLDRQVHAVTCSFIPGVGAADRTGTTGCYAALMSPYSSVLRTTLWGGIPIALPALSVFAFLLFIGAALAIRRTLDDRHETLFLLCASALPLLVSLFYLGLSLIMLGTLCKVCVGIYLASAGVFVTALLLYRAARRGAAEASLAASHSEPGRIVVPTRSATPVQPPLPLGRFGLYCACGLVFVALPLVLYTALKPAVAEAVTRCGALLRPEDRYRVHIPLHANPAGAPAIEVLDPLCPACHAFGRRLEASGLREQLDLRAVLFPLDRECNWMVSESLHPGACAVSEAVLCAGEELPEVLAWADANGDELRELGARGATHVYAQIRQRFPNLARCVGRPAVKVKLNKSLRWVVSNSLPVLTPQLFVRGRKICDEDTDLGLEYALARMLEETAAAATPRRGAKR